MRIIIKDVLTVTMNDKKEIDTLSIVIEEGTIASLSRRDVPKRKGDRVIDGSHRIAVPGFFNGHIHCDITLARGLGDGLTLYEQDFDSRISRKKWFRKELNQEARHYSRLLQYTEAVKGGTTFICDVPFWWHGDDLVSPFREVGITGGVVFDYREDFLKNRMVDEKSYLRAAEVLRSSGCIPIVEGPAEEHFEENLLIKLKTRAQELDTLLQLHLAETTWRMDLVRKRFNKTSIVYLRDIGFLGERIIGSHGVYLDGEDRAILRDTGTKLVNCPTAEMKIADGTAPIVELLQLKVPVGLGTDGALWNDSADMFSEMKSLMLLQRLAKGASSISAYDCLYAATIGGARVFGLDGELGSIEKGKRATLALIDYAKPHLLPIHGNPISNELRATQNRDYKRGEVSPLGEDESNIVQIITSCARASDVDTVIIDGNIVVEKGTLKTINEQRLLVHCQELAEKRFRVHR
jgi:5-methylthioadenosine/S-adenosylhomocysteine deaminase